MSILFAVSAMAIAIMFPVLLSLRNTGVAGVSRFVVACGLAAAAIVVSMLPETANPRFWAVSGHTLMITASLLTLAGFRAFFGRPTPGTGLLIAAVALAAISLAVVTILADSQDASSLIGSGLIALVFILIVTSTLADWPQEGSVSPHMIVCVVVASCVALFHILRILIVLSGIETVPGIGNAGLWTVALGGAHILFLPLFFLSIILMVQGRMISTLRHAIAHDDLTGVLSRRALLARLESSFAATAGTQQPLSLLLLDLDRFKQINDRHGHAGGDTALLRFCETVRAFLGEKGYMGRLGGEEFGIVLPGLDESEAAAVAQALCTLVRGTPVTTAQGDVFGITVSIGIATASGVSSTAELMLQADMALYAAKAAGRDCHRVSDMDDAWQQAGGRALAAAAAQMRNTGNESQTSFPVASTGRPKSR